MTGVSRAVAFKREASLVPPGGDTAAGFTVQCFHDILDVFFHGAHAAMQHFCDLPVPFARRDPAQDLSLPRGQRGERREGDRLEIATGQASVNLGGARGHGGWPLLTAKRAQRNGCKHVAHSSPSARRIRARDVLSIAYRRRARQNALRPPDMNFAPYPVSQLGETVSSSSR